MVKHEIDCWFQMGLGGVSFVTLVIEPRLSNVCHADVTVLASVDLRNISSAHSSTRKENDVTWVWSATSKGSNFCDFCDVWLINLAISMVAWPNAPVRKNTATHTACWSQHPICRASQLVGSDWIYAEPRSIYTKSDGNGFRLHGWQCSKTVKAPALEDKQNLFQQ